MCIPVVCTLNIFSSWEDCLIDFNGMPTRPGSFYTFTFMFFLKRFFCLQSYRTWVILHRCIWPIDGILRGTTTLSQWGTGSNGNEGVLCILQNSKSRTSPLIQFSVISKTPFFSWMCVLPVCRGYRHHILSPAIGVRTQYSAIPKSDLQLSYGTRN